MEMTIVPIRDAAVIHHAAHATQDAARRRTPVGSASCVVLTAMG